MDALAHLTAATRARRALLNNTIAALREIRPPVTQIVFDPGAITRLRAASLVFRTLLHPKK